MTDKLQIDFINKEILVSDFEASLRAHEKVMKKDEKEWKQDFTRRKTEWVESLQKDTGLEEALFIIDDMIKSGAKQKLSMIK